jgi:hypothetical protein
MEDTMHPDHSAPLCASLGHFVGTLTVVYCPHHQSWILLYHAGDEADDRSLDSARIDFGPFDSADDVARRSASVVQMLVRVTSRRWLASRREDTDD